MKMASITCLSIVSKYIHMILNSYVWYTAYSRCYLLKESQFFLFSYYIYNNELQKSEVVMQKDSDR
jgi:hypothetical protein